MSTALAKPSQFAFEPTDLDGAYRLAKVLFAGQLLPSSIKSPEAALTIIAAGRELGLTAMQSIQGIYIVDGKLSLATKLRVALIWRSGACEYFNMLKSDEKEATFETKRVGGSAPAKLTYTMEDAQRAGLAKKSNWVTNPKPMLRWRCIGQLCDLVYPDIIGNMTAEDDDEPTPVTPAKSRSEALADSLSGMPPSVAVNAVTATFEEPIA
jgi:hypothetical protein